MLPRQATCRTGAPSSQLLLWRQRDSVSTTHTNPRDPTSPHERSNPRLRSGCRRPKKTCCASSRAPPRRRTPTSQPMMHARPVGACGAVRPRLDGPGRPGERPKPMMQEAALARPEPHLMHLVRSRPAASANLRRMERVQDDTSIVPSTTSIWSTAVSALTTPWPPRVVDSPATPHNQTPPAASRTSFDCAWPSECCRGHSRSARRADPGG